MAWYRTGTVAVTNGSPVVTGTGTAFVANVQIGHALNLPDGKVYEVAAVNSDTQITLGSNYLGASGNGQNYTVTPNQGFAQQAASALAALMTQITGYISTALAGRFGDGTAAAPGISFSTDQATGIRRVSGSTLALTTGGADALIASSSGPFIDMSAGAGRIRTYAAVNVTGARLLSANTAGTTALPLEISGGSVYITAGDNTVLAAYLTSGYTVFGASTASGLGPVGGISAGAVMTRAGGISAHQTSAGVFQHASNFTVIRSYGTTAGSGQFAINVGGGAATADAEAMRIDNVGRLLVGMTTSPGAHAINYSTAGTGGKMLDLYNNSAFFNVDNFSFNSSGSAVNIGKLSTTGRTLNLAGTVNASGADYAEYMRKSATCAAIAKGDVCGVNTDGELVTAWADARWFRVKSTAPNLVGGDSWSDHLGDKPRGPVLTTPVYQGPAEPTEPVAPASPVPVSDMPVQPERGEDEDDGAFLLRLAAYMAEIALWRVDLASHDAASAEFAIATVAYQQAVSQYPVARATYEAAINAHATDVQTVENEYYAALSKFVLDTAAFETALEAARQTVDRIAKCGEIPVNMSGPVVPGDYLIAVQDGDGIGVLAVHPDDLQFSQCRFRIGAVLAIRDGRPWVEVMLG